ncbi:MAG: hypothetical protein ABIS59_00360 [Candidatus Saccharibacteria bacterium]
MPTVTDWGTMDGQPAKIVYNPDRKQTHIYWGGRGTPDGDGHNHATVQDSNPDAMHYLRVNGKVVVNQNYNPQSKSRFQQDLEARGGWFGLFRESLQRALRMYR